MIFLNSRFWRCPQCNNINVKSIFHRLSIYNNFSLDDDMNCFFCEKVFSKSDEVYLGKYDVAETSIICSSCKNKFRGLKEMFSGKSCPSCETMLPAEGYKRFTEGVLEEGVEDFPEDEKKKFSIKNFLSEFLNSFKNKPNPAILIKEKDVKGLIEIADSKKFNVHMGKAIETLGYIGDPLALESLTRCLKYKNLFIGDKAAEALGNIGDARAVEPLIEALKMPGWGHSTTVMNALVKIGVPSIRPLIEACKSDPLIKLLDSEYFINTLKDEEYEMINSISNALEKIGKPATGPLMEALKNKDTGIRSVGVMALGKLKYKNAFSHLLKLLEDKNFQVRFSVCSSLGYLEDERAVEPLIGCLKDENEKVRFSSALSLGNLKDDKSVISLIETLNDFDGSVRWASAQSLGAIKDVRAVIPLINALKDKDERVRMYSAFSLGKIGDKRAIEPLKNLLNDEVIIVRKWTKAALRMLNVDID